MTNVDFFGAIQNADVVDIEASKYLGGNESVIGCECTLTFGMDDTGYPKVSIQSPHDHPFGAFSSDFSGKLTRLHNLGNDCRVFLSAVAYQEEEKVYQGEYTVLFFPAEQKEIWDRFCVLLQKKIADGAHPDVKLSTKTLRLVIDAKGDWCNLQKAPYAKLSNGIYVKKRRSAKDGLIEKAIGGNKGCLVASWIIFIVIIIAVLFAIYWFFFSR